MATLLTPSPKLGEGVSFLLPNSCFVTLFVDKTTDCEIFAREPFSWGSFLLIKND